jgi:hypothetical protein
MSSHALVSARRRALRIGCILLASGEVSCGGGDAGGPTPQIDELFLSVSTLEYEPPRWLMVVGEKGSAHALAFRDDLGADPGLVSFTASSPGVLAIASNGQADAELTALAVGSVQVRASALGRSDVQTVEVLAAPLPVDLLQVRLANISSSVPAPYDSEGSLATIELPAGGSAALDLRVEREGRLVTTIPFELTSSDPDVAQVYLHCRPPAADPDCSVVSHWGWVTGAAAGTSTVTVTVRNLSTAFAVTTTPPE